MSVYISISDKQKIERLKGVVSHGLKSSHNSYAISGKDVGITNSYKSSAIILKTSSFGEILNLDLVIALRDIAPNASLLDLKNATKSNTNVLTSSLDAVWSPYTIRYIASHLSVSGELYYIGSKAKYSSVFNVVQNFEGFANKCITVACDSLITMINMANAQTIAKKPENICIKIR